MADHDNTQVGPASHRSGKLCERCGGEGKLYTSRYGGNDPDVWPTGDCPVCEGTGYEPVEDDACVDRCQHAMEMAIPGYERCEGVCKWALSRQQHAASEWMKTIGWLPKNYEPELHGLVEDSFMAGHAAAQRIVPTEEKIAQIIYETDPFYEGGEYVDSFQVSPGGYLTWEQAKARDAEFGDDPRMGKITEFAYKAARAIAKAGGR